MEEKSYPTEQEIYEQILAEIRQRGFGLLLAYTGLGAFEPGDASWAEVTLVGEDYKAFFLHINPRSIQHFEDPATYIDDLISEDASPEERQRVIEIIRAGNEKAMQTGRFVYSDPEQVGLKEVEEAVKEYLPKLYPELRASLKSRLTAINRARVGPISPTYGGMFGLFRLALRGVKLYLVGSDEIDSWAEYWSEVEEVIQDRYGLNLQEFLRDKEPIVIH